MKSEDIDLRDEVQYLRELVETLMRELKEARSRQSEYLTPPPPIIINPLPQIVDRTPYWIHEHHQWFTTTAGANNLSFTFNCDTNTITNDDFGTWTGTNG